MYNMKNEDSRFDKDYIYSVINLLVWLKFKKDDGKGNLRVIYLIKCNTKNIIQNIW